MYIFTFFLLQAGSVDDDDNEENQDVMQPAVPSYSVAHIAVRFYISVVF